MTLSEFKYWLEGFDEAVSEAPTPAQWKRIKERIGEVEPDVEVRTKVHVEKVPVGDSKRFPRIYPSPFFEVDPKMSQYLLAAGRQEAESLK